MTVRYVVRRRWQVGSLVLYERHDYASGEVRRMFWMRVHRSGVPFRVSRMGRWRERRFLRQRGL